MFFKYFYGKHYKVVKIYCIIKFKPILIFFIKSLVRIMLVCPILSSHFDIGKKNTYLINIQGIRREFKFSSAFFNQLIAVGFVINTEITSPAYFVDVGTQNLNSKSVKGADSQVLKFFAGKLFYPIRHFLGSLIGKGKSQNLRLGNPLVEHVCNSKSDNACFPRTCSRYYKNGPVNRSNGLKLFGIKTFSKFIHRKGEYTKKREIWQEAVG